MLPSFMVVMYCELASSNARLTANALTVGCLDFKPDAHLTFHQIVAVQPQGGIDVVRLNVILS